MGSLILINISIALWHVCIDGEGVVLCSRSTDGHGGVVAKFMESCVVHLPRVSRDSLLAALIEKVLDGLPMIFYSCCFSILLTT